MLNLNVAEAKKARQLGGAAGCQNLCPFPPLLPNRTTTYAQTSSSFSSSSSSTGCAYSSGLFSSSRCEFRQDDRVFENPNYPQQQFVTFISYFALNEKFKFSTRPGCHNLSIKKLEIIFLLSNLILHDLHCFSFDFVILFYT